jgi:hypothetical protein
MKKKLNVTLIALCISLAAHAQRPLRWVADATQTAFVTFDCTRGETLTFTPYIKAYGITLTNYTASLQWQTNGMGTAFWSTNALVFTPSMDVGANRYRFWIRAESTNGVMYSAQGTINMLHGPGFTPNTLPLPVQLIDFGSVSTTNAPWLLAETDPGIPAAIDSAVAQAGTNAQTMASTAQSNAIAFTSTNQTTRLFNPTNTQEFIDGAGNKYCISNFWDMTFSPEFYSWNEDWPQYTNYLFTGYSFFVESIGSGFDSIYWTMQWTEETGFYVSRVRGLSFMQWVSTTNQYVLSFDYYPGSGYVYIRPYSTTNLVATLATEAGTMITIGSHNSDTNAHPAIVASLPSFTDVTNAVTFRQELHIDSYTNIIWRSVYSNGWMWIVAYTNTP